MTLVFAVLIGLVFGLWGMLGSKVNGGAWTAQMGNGGAGTSGRAAGVGGSGLLAAGNGGTANGGAGG